MPDRTNSWVRRIRDDLRRGGSREHAEGVQWFFKEEVRSHGWYTAALRRFARQTSREIQETGGMETLLKVADKLFTGEVLEEKNFAVLLLEKSVEKFGEREFKLFESWLDRVTSWADHDALVHYLIGPLVAAEPRRTARVFRWTKSRNRWRRRAAAVSLIRGARQRLVFDEIVRVSNALLQDQDDMVQKGLGWLLREAAKADRKRTVPYLLRIRDRAPRVVLRTACETLTPAMRARVLSAAQNQKLSHNKTGCHPERPRAPARLRGPRHAGCWRAGAEPGKRSRRISVSNYPMHL